MIFESLRKLKSESEFSPCPVKKKTHLKEIQHILLAMEKENGMEF
jgi:hypothetical protein